MGNQIAQALDSYEDPKLLGEEAQYSTIPNPSHIGDQTTLIRVLCFNIPTKGFAAFEVTERPSLVRRMEIQKECHSKTRFASPSGCCYIPRTSQKTSRRYERDTLKRFLICFPSFVEYDFFGRGRTANDGSEYQPIFFRKSRFDVHRL